jgi:hypothetical protein
MIPRLVWVVWLIIVGGWIIIFGKPPQCIICMDGILTIMAVISILFGIVGLVDHFRNRDPGTRV